MMHDEEDAGFEIDQIIKQGGWDNLPSPDQSGTGSADNDDDGLNTSNDDDDNIGEVSAFGVSHRGGGGGLLSSWSKKKKVTVAVIAASAFLFVVGLGAGLGSKNSKSTNVSSNNSNGNGNNANNNLDGTNFGSWSNDVQLELEFGKSGTEASIGNTNGNNNGNSGVGNSGVGNGDSNDESSNSNILVGSGNNSSNNSNSNNGKKPTKVATADCTIQIATLLPIPNYFDNDDSTTTRTIVQGEDVQDDDSSLSFQEEIFDCELSPQDTPQNMSGLTRQLNLTPSQTKRLKDLWRNGDLIPGVSQLKIAKSVSSGGSGGDLDLGVEGVEVEFDESELKVPVGWEIQNFVERGNSSDNVGNGNGNGVGNNSNGVGNGNNKGGEEVEQVRKRQLKGNKEHQAHRKLTNGGLTGTKPILVVRVTDKNGLARDETAAQISDDVFGTNGDPVNLKSQLEGCSMNKLKIQAGVPQHEQLYSNPNSGVLEVTIAVSLDNTRSVVRNSITAAVNAELGISLPGQYDQVMYVIQKCIRIQDNPNRRCGWAAYAYYNNWSSVYQGRYYKLVGVQVHELGHNFGMAHSGGIDGVAYSDHTGMMGNPLYSDDVGKMCYNAAKNWYLPWYNDRKKQINPLASQLPNTWATSLEMVGIADYENQATNTLPVVLKLETNTPDDYFIAFNRAAGVNSQNDQADDELTIITTGNNGGAQSQSYLKATLSQDESYIIKDFGGTGKDIIVHLCEIDRSSSFNGAWVARISLSRSEAGVRCPTNSPTKTPTKTPTAFPTKFPTSSPSDSPSTMPTSSPSKSPTSKPTSPSCSPGQVEVIIAVKTDEYPTETSWELSNICTSTTEKKSTPYDGTDKSKEFSDTLCVDPGQYKFAIYDSPWSDGLCCVYGNGSYSVMYDGEQKANGGDFAASEESTFGDPCPPPPTKSPTPPPTISPTKRPTAPPVATDADNGCPPGEMPLKIDVLTDNYPTETSWYLTNTCTGTEERSSPPQTYKEDNESFQSSFCVPSSNRYTFEIKDVFNDGVCCKFGEGSFTVTYGNVVVESGGDFGANQVVPFGGSCDVVATYDADVGAPRCADLGFSCTSGPQLLDGHGGYQEPNKEPNQPNTLDGCNDGNSGRYQDDEAVDMITVSSVGGGLLQIGSLAEVEAKVWAWRNGQSDIVDFYYATNGANPAWELIQSITPPAGGAQTLKARYTLLPSSGGSRQAVRVNIRYAGSQKDSGCSGGSYDDADDLVFEVASEAAAARNIAEDDINLAEIEIPLTLTDEQPLNMHCGSLSEDRCVAASPYCMWHDDIRICHDSPNDENV